MQVQLVDMRLCLMLLELHKGVQPSFICLQGSIGCLKALVH